MAAAIFNLPLWGMRTFQRQYTALKLGHLSHKQILEKPTVRFKAVDEEDPSTNPKNITVESKALKSCCNNALAVSVMVLMEHDHKRLVQIVVNISLPVKKWHIEKNKELRDVYSTTAWLIRQLDGDLMQYLYSFLEQLCDQIVLKKCQFRVPVSEWVSEWVR